MVIINFIYSILVLLFGSAVAIIVLLFGVKFCGNCGELEANPSWKDILLQLVRGYPFWVWMIVLMVFQPAIIHIINAWDPSILSPYGWILNLSNLIAFISLVIYIIIVKITDSNGRFKKIKEIKWRFIKTPLSRFGESFLFKGFLNQSSFSCLISCSLCKIFFSNTNRFWCYFY